MFGDEAMKIKYPHSRISRLLVCMLTVCAVVLTALPGVYMAAADSSDASISVDPTGKSDGYSAVMYDNTNGLPTSEANAIAQTDEGFIWIGSYSGLIRYDGNSFERYDSTTGIASVVSLFVDSKNRLWVGTNDSGVAVLDKGEFKIFGKADGLRSLSVRAITEDSSGTVYIATTHGIVTADDDLNITPIDQPQINDEYIRTLELGSDDILYGVTIDGAVFTMKNRAVVDFYNAEKMGISEIRAFLPDPQNPGYAYVGNRGDTVYYGHFGAGFEVSAQYKISPLDGVNSIEAVDEMIWICTDSGIGYLRNGEFMTVASSVPMNISVEGMMIDYQKNLWFVSSQQGVMKIVPNQFTNIYEKYMLESNVVYTTCVYNDKLFIGTSDGNLTVLGGGEALSELPIKSSVTASGQPCPDDKDLIPMLLGHKIRSIVKDSKNRIWISTFSQHCLVRYDGENVTKFTMADGMPSERVRTVCEGKDGTFYAACTGGVAVIKDDKVVKVYNESDGLANTEILNLVLADNGDIIVGTDGGGIYIIGSSGVSYRGTDSGLMSDVVMRIKKDLSRDIYWIVTSNSIAYMTSDYSITTIKNFPYSNNFDLYENSRGDMWVLSSNGIYVVHVDDLLKNEDIDPIYYGKDNGLFCIPTSNSYSELTDNGELFISGTTGVAKVNIEKPFDSVDDIKISVPYIEADGERVYPDEDGDFTIPSDTKKLTIYSFVFNYSLLNPQVTYHLEGFDSGSSSVKRSELTPVSYTNLKGGSYTFVMDIDDINASGTKELIVHIVKEKTFYEKLWFKMVCFFAVIAVIVVIVKLLNYTSKKYYMKKDREQKTLIREIVEAFAKVIDMKDRYTNGHSTRVAEYTVMLAREMGLDDETVEKYYNIALLHDIGKVGVKPEVLNKQGKLTDNEFAQIKAHSALGYNALKDISIMPELAIGAGSHHERPDGKGYPKGLKGNEIPRVAQIIAVADTFDAMYSDRPYRKRMNFDRAVSIIKEVRGTQLSEDVVDAFLRLVGQGKFRAPDDTGGGTTEDIDNIRHKADKAADAPAQEEKTEEESDTQETEEKTEE